MRSGKSNTNGNPYIAPAHANSNRDVYCDADDYTEAFTDAETGANAQAASHAATAPITIYEKETLLNSDITSRAREGVRCLLPPASLLANAFGVASAKAGS